MTSIDHITVCICTYKRPRLLAQLLDAVIAQETAGLFTFSAVVVDNDENRSAQETVSAIQAASSVTIEYHVEPRKNISHARNMTLDKAEGTLVAFIDDDGVPVDRWLLEMYRTLEEFNADGVLGSMPPRFEEPPPAWIAKHRVYFWIHERPVSGIILPAGNTGNALVKRAVLRDVRFSPAFGLSGGEDSLFFRRLVGAGCVLVTCSGGVVYDVIPPDRCRLAYILKRNLLNGRITVRYSRALSKPRTFHCWWFLKALIAIQVYYTLLPFSIVLGRGAIAVCLIKLAYFFGVLAEYTHLGVLTGRADLDT